MTSRLYIPALAALMLATAPDGLFAQAAKGVVAKKGPFKGAKKLPGPNKQAALERFSRMTPDERQRALDRLPPERREKIEQQLRQYNSMSPVERRQLEAFRDLPPERQETVRRIYRRMNNLPEDRRTAVRD